MALINEKINQFQVAAMRRIHGFEGISDEEAQWLYRAALNYAEFSTPVKVRLTMRRVRDLKPGDLIVGRVGGAIKKVIGVYPDASNRGHLGHTGEMKWRVDFVLDNPNWNREGHDFRYPDFYYLIVKQEQLDA
ncbi:hypothetical protein SOP91_00195 (plasmid) [Enterobacter hormaechei]|uniref:hypothetical protein n=1 Tax=Enterobacter hormaechei TaxID=158836 RepID=UPI002B4C198B|nr:hypothetical protein [Enterobacter hormaechei]WRM07130.1 hypothetical protein SOP91_00195 [Enterobacter hormaechei]